TPAESARASGIRPGARIRLQEMGPRSAERVAEQQLAGGRRHVQHGMPQLAEGTAPHPVGSRMRHVAEVVAERYDDADRRASLEQIPVSVTSGCALRTGM